MILKQAGKVIGVVLWTLSCVTLSAAGTVGPSPAPGPTTTNAPAQAGNRPQTPRLRPDQMPISKIGSFTPELAQRKTNRTVRIQGVVLDQALGDYVIIQDETGTIRAETRETTPIGPGERVSAWGRVSWDGNNVFLRGASIRPLAWDSIAEEKITPADSKPSQLPTLTQIIQIRGLAPAQAAWKYPVHIRGVVTSLWRDYKSLFVQDDAAGIFVAAGTFNLDTNWNVGDEVEIEASPTRADTLPSSWRIPEGCWGGKVCPRATGHAVSNGDGPVRQPMGPGARRRPLGSSRPTIHRP